MSEMENNKQIIKLILDKSRLSDTGKISLLNEIISDIRKEAI